MALSEHVSWLYAICQQSDNISPRATMKAFYTVVATAESAIFGTKSDGKKAFCLPLQKRF